jgi:D-galactarolactone cycloisomerase
MARTANVAVHPYVWNSGVGVAAAVQFAVSLPDYPYSEHVREAPLLEFDRGENPLRDDLLVDPFDPSDGELAVPQSPGLGVEVDETAVERYRIDD